MASMNYALLAEASEVKLHANWPHPKFIGELLPETRAISDQGFDAQWKATSFSYNVTQSLNDCAQGQCSSLLNRAVGFELLQPVDVYQQAERSVKYAILFIILTFVALILFELLQTATHSSYSIYFGGVSIDYILFIAHLSFRTFRFPNGLCSCCGGECRLINCLFWRYFEKYSFRLGVRR